MRILLTNIFQYANLLDIMISLKKIASQFPLLLLVAFVFVKTAVADSAPIQVPESALGFHIPTMTDVLTFMIRTFFAVAGIIALLYLLLGALAWITSGGNKESVEKARDKIQNAIVGLILIVLVLALMYTLEQVVFAGKICFGISCPMTLPSLLKPL